MKPRPIYWLLGTLLLALLVDLPTLRGGFVYDDTLLVLRNTLTDSWGNLGTLFRTDLWAGVPDHNLTPYYRPLMSLSLVLDRQLFGLEPAGYHLHSLLWQLLVVGLTWRLLRGIADDPVAAAAGAALVALHPLHLEVVAFVSARNDAMAAAGVLGALILLERPRPGPLRLLGAGLCALFALLSKESAALVLPLLPVLDLARAGSARELVGRWRRGWVRALPLAVALGIWLLLRSRALLLTATGQGYAAALAQAPEALAFYASELLWPLSYDPAVYISQAPPEWGWLLPLALLLGLGLALGGRRALAGLLLAGTSFAPALIGMHFADLYAHRYAYLPLVGLALVAHAALAGRMRPPIRAGAAAVAGGLAVASGLALPVWRSTLSFWQHAYAQRPNALTACPLHVEYDLAGREDLAEPLLRAALAGPVLADCCYRASRFYVRLGRQEEAVAAGRQALAAGCAESPELVEALAMAELWTACSWERSAQRVRGLGRSPYGYRPLILAGEALRRGDDGPLRRLAGDGGVEALRRRVQVLLDRCP